MGDVLLTTPVLRMIKKRFPQAQLDFLVKESYIALLENNPHIDSLFSLKSKACIGEMGQIIANLRGQRYDLIVDLQSNIRSILISLFCRAQYKVRVRLNRFRRLLLVRFKWETVRTVKPIPLRYLDTVRLFGVIDDGKGLELFVNNQSRESIHYRLKLTHLKSLKPIVALAPGAGRATKRWIESGFAQVGQHFLDRGFEIVIVGGREDADVSRRIANLINPFPMNLSGDLSLTETAAVLDKSILLITNDTGLMHMAAALNKSLVALFGPTTDQLGFFPFRAHSIVLERQLDCRPCSYHGSVRCPKGHFKCMIDISHHEVISAAHQLLNKG
jgi:heptosyltransferase-2